MTISTVYPIQIPLRKSLSKSMTISGQKGKLTYAITSKGKLSGVKISKTAGTITVPKGTKKGTYKIKVKVTAAGNSNYKSGSKTVTITIKIA